MNKQEKPNVAVIGGGECFSCSEDAIQTSFDMCGINRESKESNILILPNGYTKEEIEKLIIEHNISSDTKVGTLNAQGMLETIDGQIIELHRGLEVKPKEIVLPYTSPRQFEGIEEMKNTRKLRKPYWSKGKLKYK